MRSPDAVVMGASGVQRHSRTPAALRTVGAVAVLVVGVVHLEQYFAVHIDSVPTIGTLFLLNFAGASVIGLGLLIPAPPLRVVRLLLALGGVALAATSFVFLFVSEHQPLFGFQEHGYRAAIVVALAAEAVAVVTLAAYLATELRRRD
ncbi:MAG TPA: hypothetical protein VE984_11005 [Gaiellaceae bacterium]|nr:hypothetical protein [Gaiellaceae bacterium]